MTNKPMLSVELLPCPFCGDSVKCAERKPAGMDVDFVVTCKRCHLSFSPLCAMEEDCERLWNKRALLDNPVLESQYDGMNQAQAQSVSDGVDEILHGKPAAQHQGEPVVWVECSPAWLKAGGDCATAPRICVGREDISHLHPAHSSAEQPAPVADQTQCEECKGWGYHENHYEGGGTECGDCGGSGNATVSLVMPERLNTEGGYSLEAETWYNLALDDVASLNGVTK